MYRWAKLSGPERSLTKQWRFSRSATLDSPKALGILIAYLFIVAMDKKQEYLSAVDEQPHCRCSPFGFCSPLSVARNEFRSWMFKISGYALVWKIWHSLIIAGTCIWCFFPTKCDRFETFINSWLFSSILATVWIDQPILCQVISLRCRL